MADPQLDMSKSVPLQQQATAPQAGGTGAPVLDMSKSVSVTGGGGNTGGAGGGWDSPPQDRGVLTNLAGGVAKEGAALATGAGNLIASGVEKMKGYPAGSLQSTSVEHENPSIARDIGQGAAQIGEFAMGDEALEGLGKATKMVELADKYPAVARTLALAKEHPVLAKIITSAGKGAAVGGAQGAVEGASEGKATEGAEGGAAGGAVGGLVGETASEIAGSLAKKLGVGAGAVENATRAAKPNKRNIRFADDFLRAAPLMDAESQISKAAGDKVKTLEDWADATDTARQKLWNEKVQPIINDPAVATQPLGGIYIRDQIASAIPESMKKFNPEKAVEIQRFANDFMPGQVFALQVKDAEADLEHLNAELAATGYWSKTPPERAALLKTDPQIIKYKIGADAIRDQLYNTLDQLKPGNNMQELKKTYGSLRNVGNEIRGQVNVQGRQSPVSLKEAIGLIAGIGHGGPVGAVMAGVPIVDKFANSPARMLGRAVNKATRPTEKGAIEKGVGAVRGGMEKLAPVTGAAAGRYIFQASDGSVHSVPDTQAHRDAVTQADPNHTPLE